MSARSSFEKREKNGNASEALEVLVELGLEKLDPVKKAQRTMRRQEQKRQTVELNNQTQLPGNVQPSSQFQGPRQSHSEGETKEQRHIENQNRNGIQDQTHAQAQIEIQTDSQNHLQSKSQMYERKTNLSQTQCRIHKQHPQDLRDIPLPISNAATATVQTKKTDHFQPKARTSPR